MAVKIAPNIRTELKAAGILSNRDMEHFSIRVITENGVLDAQKMAVLTQVARKYGNGSIAMTSRMTLELGGFHYEDLDAARKMIADGGMETGGTGKKVRPVVACKGTVCVFGLIDTQALGAEIHKRFYEGYRGVTLPHKFKIAVGGCPNNCVKPDLNDVGIIGQRLPKLNEEKCHHCKKCAMEMECPMKAVAVDETGTPRYNEEICNHCGRCIRKCPFGAGEEVLTGYKVVIGGRWGKSIRIGTPLNQVFTKEEALDMVEKALLLFKEKGLPGERFSTTIERLGFDNVEKELLGDGLLKRKAEILGDK